MTTQVCEFVFVHSYSSGTPNWREIMLGSKGHDGRVTKALKLAQDIGVPVIANDGYDVANRNLYADMKIENLNTARNTLEEVISALEKSTNGAVLFVSSPDHLPRIVRDVLSEGGTRSIFAASETAFSSAGVRGVIVTEPPHEKHQDVDNSANPPMVKMHSK